MKITFFFVGFASIQLTWDVYSGWKSAIPQHGNKLWPKHPRGYRGNISAGGVIPHQMTLMLLSPVAEMDQIIDSTIVMFGPMATTSNTLYEYQPKYTCRWHGLGLGFKGVLPQGHDKVISRSQQGQISLKLMKIVYCSGIAPILLTWDVYGGWNSHSLQHGNIPKHPTRLQGWYNGTNIFFIPENLGVEALFVNIWWQVAEIWHIFIFRWLTWPMTLTHVVTLTLNYEKQCHQRIPRTRKPRCRAIICFHMMTGYWDIAHFHFLHWSCDRHFEYAN